MKRSFKVALMALLALAVVAGAAFAAPKYRWQFAAPWTRPLSDKGYQLFCDKVKEYTNGDIEIRLFSSGLLGTHDETLHGVRDGDIEIATLSPYVNLVPGGMLDWMPWTVSTFDEARLAYTCRNFDNEKDPENVGILFRIMDDVWGEVGCKELFNAAQGAYGLANNVRPLRVPSDLSNLKMRVSSSMASVRCLQNMGKGCNLNLVTLPWAEIYQALSRNVVDGCWDMWPSLVDERHCEVLKYYTHGLLNWDANNIVINRELWDSLKPEYKKALLKAGYEAEMYLYDLYEAEEQKYIDKLKAMPNFHIIEITEEERAQWREAANMGEIWAEMCDPWLKKHYPNGEHTSDSIRAELEAIRVKCLKAKEAK